MDAHYARFRRLFGKLGDELVKWDAYEGRCVSCAPDMAQRVPACAIRSGVQQRSRQPLTRVAFSGVGEGPHEPPRPARPPTSPPRRAPRRAESLVGTIVNVMERAPLLADESKYGALAVAAPGTAARVQAKQAAALESLLTDLREVLSGMEAAASAMDAVAAEGRRALRGREGEVSAVAVASTSGGRPSLAECAQGLADAALAFRGDLAAKVAAVDALGYGLPAERLPEVRAVFRLRPHADRLGLGDLRERVRETQAPD